MIELLLNTLLFVAGFLILIRGADSFIEYSAKLGRKLGMKPVLIGLTIVSMGTSFPELAISMLGALKGSAEISLGNIIGSNIANVGLFLGFAGFIRILHVKKNIFTTETPLMILSMVAFFFFMFNDNTISKIEGTILIIIFLGYITYVFKTGLKNSKDPLIHDIVEDTKSRMSRIKLSFYTFGGLTGLLLGSYLIVDSGIEIARMFGIGEAIIALSAMALGTSIPEITSSIVALKKGEKEVAYGGIIGSITFNTLLIVGISSFVTTLTATPRIIQDGLVMIVFGIMMLPFAVSSFRLTKYISTGILCLYMAWIISLFF